MGVLNACVNVGAFRVGMHVELKLKLEVNVLEVWGSFQKKFKFVVEDYAMLQQLWHMEFSFCNSTRYVTNQQAILPNCQG
jgi:hypothetical protein